MDVFSQSNGICGSLSVFLAMKYLVTANHSFLWISIALLPLSFFFDVIDGQIARWRHMVSPLGQELDSLADLISFGVAPAVLGFAVGLQELFDIVLLTFFIACCVSRLARFNSTAADMVDPKLMKVKYFEGIPSPTAGLTVTMLIGWVVHRGWLGENVAGGVVQVVGNQSMHPISVVYFILGSMMVSKRLRVPKP
ncbi:hypothetical protein BKA69DRAFT_1109529 [Paraphysoderma sedebokerense]|nr:hypothetical protein BKA69DRAFT_1109529 [Paraphysoderma sedebokerense]